MYKTRLFLDLEGGAYCAPLRAQGEFLQDVERFAANLTNGRPTGTVSDKVCVHHVFFRKVSPWHLLIEHY